MHLEWRVNPIMQKMNKQALKVLVKEINIQNFENTREFTAI